MKRLLAAVILMTAWAAAATAQTATQNINLTASVPLSCTITGSTTPAADSINFGTLGTGASAISTSTVYPATAGSTGFAVVCNSSTHVQLSTLKDGLRNTTVAPSGYTSNINYSASATLGSATATITTAGTNAPSTGAQVNNSGPTSSNMVVSVTPAANTLPLTPGSYADTLTVTITAH
jgi:hypothetical protein